MIDPLWRLMIVVLLILAEALVTCMESALKKANECFFEKKVEERDGEFFTGHAPNYTKVYACGENLHNEIKDVEITEVYRDGVLGRIL